MKWLVSLFAAACAVAFGQGAIGAPMPAHASFTLDSAVLKETRTLNVYTPPGYDARKDVRYPVLYMPDGGLDEDFPHVAIDIDAAVRARAIPPMIVIGIANTERRRDMTGPTEVDSDRKIAAHVGGSAAFRAFIADELMPEVRRRYRTNGNNAIVGESLAGLFVLETFLLQPKLFDSYIALSPSLWWNHPSLVQGAEARLKAWPAGLRTTLYFATAGDDGIEDAAHTLQSSLRSTSPAGQRWFHEARPDLHHSDIYVRASPQVFRKVFGAKASH